MKPYRRIAITVCALFLVLATVASAYSYFTAARWTSMPVPYNEEYLPSAWKWAVGRAIVRWNDVVPSSFRYETRTSGVNPLFLATEDGKGGVGAHMDYTSSGGEMTTFYVHFDKDESWHLEEAGGVPADKLDAISIAIHELGHATTLADSYHLSCVGTSGPSMCWCFGYGQSHFRTLAQDDINGLNNKYP